MKKILPIVIPVAAAFLLVTGCSTQSAAPNQPASNQASSNNQQTEQQPAKDQASQPAPSSTNPTTSDPSANSSTSNQSQPSTQSPKLVVKEGTGEYTGMIDGNSVEIIVDGEAKAFRLTEVSKPMVEKLKSKTRVLLHYTEAEQLVLQDIQEANK